MLELFCWDASEQLRYCLSLAKLRYVLVKGLSTKLSTAVFQSWEYGCFFFVTLPVCSATRERKEKKMQREKNWFWAFFAPCFTLVNVSMSPAHADDQTPADQFRVGMEAGY